MYETILQDTKTIIIIIIREGKKISKRYLTLTISWSGVSEISLSLSGETRIAIGWIFVYGVCGIGALLFTYKDRGVCA